MYKHHNRIWSVDILRGLFINLMMIAHAIFFFHTQTSPILVITNRLIDAVAFTGLLFLSGMTGYISYIHKDHPTKNTNRRILKRTAIYLAGYYILSITADIILHGVNLNHLFGILTFQRLVPFTEFIIPFLIFALLKIPLRKVYARLSQSLQYTLLAGGILLTIGTLLSLISYPSPLTFITNIIIGYKGTFSFPILSYMPIYLLGIYIGKWHWDNHHAKTRLRHIAKIGGGLSLALIPILLLSFIIDTPFTVISRWPPSIAFVLVGTIFTLFMIWVVEKLHNLYRMPWIRNFLLLSGQNAFALFFTHTMTLYIYSAFDFTPIYSPILISMFWVISVLFALYLAKILPLNYHTSLNFIRWCDCQLHQCSHAKERRLIILMKRSVMGLVNLPELFSFKVGKRRIKPIKLRNLAVFVGLFVVFAVPLGLAENVVQYSNEIKRSQGTTNRTWYIPTLNPDIVYNISLPTAIEQNSDPQVFYQIDNLPKSPLPKDKNQWKVKIPTASLDHGEHQIKTLVTTIAGDITTQTTKFIISKPLYITWTIDWEGYDTSDESLDALISISEDYKIPMTHLFNPRIYTAPDISKDRAEYLTQWVINRRDTYNEEIGLHLHMFVDFVSAAGVTPRNEPNWHDGSGYDVLTTAYTREEMIQILGHAKDLFQQHELGTPKSYRAGAWFANLDTLHALDISGFLLDSSARTKYSFGSKQIAGYWDVSPTTQPYYPSFSNQNSDSPKPQLSILEIPNNGADTYAFSAKDMLDRFHQNYPGDALDHKRQVTFLTHPHWFDVAKQQKIRTVFEEVNKYRYSDDSGPVIPTTLLGVYQAWTKL